LESAAGFLRNALSKSLMIRYTPTLSFELDSSIEHGVRLTQLIDSVNKREDSAAGESAATPEDEGHVVDEGDYDPG
jgi:ribosome-binding factor A